MRHSPFPAEDSNQPISREPRQTLDQPEWHSEIQDKLQETCRRRSIYFRYRGTCACERLDRASSLGARPVIEQEICEAETTQFFSSRSSRYFRLCHVPDDDQFDSIRIQNIIAAHQCLSIAHVI